MCKETETRFIETAAVGKKEGLPRPGLLQLRTGYFVLVLPPAVVLLEPVEPVPTPVLPDVVPVLPDVVPVLLEPVDPVLVPVLPEPVLPPVPRPVLPPVVDEPVVEEEPLVGVEPSSVPPPLEHPAIRPTAKTPLKRRAKPFFIVHYSLRISFGLPVSFCVRYRLQPATGITIKQNHDPSFSNFGSFC